MRVLTAAAVASLLASGCVGDAKVTVSGTVTEASCMFNRYAGEKLVESFPIEGKFSQRYAVSMATPKRVEIVCSGVVVAKENLSVTGGDVDFGEVP